LLENFKFSLFTNHHHSLLLNILYILSILVNIFYWAVREPPLRNSYIYILTPFARYFYREGTLASTIIITGSSRGIGATTALMAAQSSLRQVMEINVLGTMFCSQEAVRRMSTKQGGNGGAIVNITSRAAQYGSPGEFVHYAASKAAVESFSFGLATEVAAEGIRVNCVSAGLVDTELHAAAGDPGRAERFASRIPIGRAGTAEEIAQAVLWLLSGEASYCTGSVLAVTGGR
jgi:NAD(P)-dependent dehydrogenase (short-subunit alcohol dehydrogenase family)